MQSQFPLTQQYNNAVSSEYLPQQHKPVASVQASTQGQLDHLSAQLLFYNERLDAAEKKNKELQKRASDAITVQANKRKVQKPELNTGEKKKNLFHRLFHREPKVCVLESSKNKVLEVLCWNCGSHMAVGEKDSALRLDLSTEPYQYTMKCPSRLGGCGVLMAVNVDIMRKREFDAAIKSVKSNKELQNEYKEFVEQLLEKGNAALDSGDIDSALKAFKKGLELIPGHPSCTQGYVRATWKLIEPQKNKTLQAFMKALPDLGFGDDERNAHLWIKRFDEYVEAFHSGFVEVVRISRQLIELSKLTKESLPEIDQALGELFYILSVCLQAKKDPEQEKSYLVVSEEWLSKAQEANPNDGELLFYLGQVLRRQSHLANFLEKRSLMEEALDAYEAILDRSKNIKPKYYWALVETYRELAKNGSNTSLYQSKAEEYDKRFYEAVKGGSFIASSQNLWEHKNQAQVIELL
ncbi:MAG: hypothetical protein CMO81_00555 [Waddliaceae bacterium]|nr:hypothetical protein [Waddliaceae bacterium]